MNLNEYVKKVEGLCIDYDGVYGHQCVDLIKHYSQNVLGFKLGSFGGSAKTGWFNESNTFPADKFQKIINIVSAIPEAGDIIFIKTNTRYWHVAIVLEADIIKIKVLEQNTGNGNGIGYDDRTKIGNYDYNNVLGWYHFIGNEKKEDKIQNILDEAKDLGIWNGRNKEAGVTRQDAVLMIMKLREILKNKKD